MDVNNKFYIYSITYILLVYILNLNFTSTLYQMHKIPDDHNDDSLSKLYIQLD